MPSSIDPSRRQALVGTELRVLVRGQWGDEVPENVEPAPMPLGAAMVSGTTGWLLPDPQRTRRGAGVLGGLLARALREQLGRLHILIDIGLADDAGAAAALDAGTLARRAGAFSLPITVWQVRGKQLTEVAAAPLPPEQPLDPEILAWATVLTDAGAEPVPEHGMLLGEVLGLEVARVVSDQDGRPMLELGVGRYERELHAVRHHGAPPPAVLAEAVATVRELRRPGLPGHTANQLAHERWLRTVLIAHPELAGMARLEPAAPALPRGGLSERSPAPAVGTDSGGNPALVVASTGVDLDLVPAAADARLAAAARLGLEPGEVRLVLVVPEGDDHQVNHRLAAILDPPATIVTVPRDWREIEVSPRS
jgi:hypothetical protein